MWYLLPVDDKQRRRKEEALAAFDRLIDIIDTLRSPEGCPWDRKQTPSSLKPYIIEEAYEVLDAIDSGQPDHLREELGDLLLQIMLQSQIFHESGQFHVGDVVDGLSKKMIHRHPHVFGEVQVNGADEVVANWEKIKAGEKNRRGLFEGVPAALPALLKSFRMGQKASRVNFDWPDAVQVRAKVVEELAELDEAIAAGRAGDIEHELGDLLFAVAQWARHLHCDPEEALRRCCERFELRLSSVQERLHRMDRSMGDCSLEELEQLWQDVKRHEQTR